MTDSKEFLERVSRGLLAILPRFTSAEQRLALALYRQLALGSPVPREKLAEVLNTPTPTVADLLDGDRLRSLVFYDDRRRVIGFGGLAIRPMHHRLLLQNRELYAWCAWDTLFLPERLGATVRVESPCVETGETVSLTVTPEGVEGLRPEAAVVSFLLPTAALFSGDPAKVLASFCHYVFFFASPNAGAAWTAQHPHTFLLSVEQAFALAKRANAALFPDVRLGVSAAA